MTEAAIIGAVVGAAVTALGAVIVRRLTNVDNRRHDLYQRTSAPYSDIAKRLAVVEEQAAGVPILQAHLWHFSVWSEHVIGWAEQVRKMVNGSLGDPLPPLPPSPKIDRRLLFTGPPFGWDRRYNEDPDEQYASSAHSNVPPPPPGD